MIHMIEISMNLNVFEETDLFIDPKHIKKSDPKHVVVLTTGTQGEEKAGLLLMAQDRHKFITLNKEDTIILSSSFIPGNEQSINTLLNLLYKKELKVITNKDQEVHTTGHASAEELKSLIGWTRPKYFIPIHGEPIQLVSHKNLALEAGIPEANIFVLENGERLELTDKGAKTIDKIKFKSVYREGNKTQNLSIELFEERHALAENGVIFIYLVTQGSQVEVELQTKGFIDRNRGTDTVEGIKEVVTNYSKKHIAKMEKSRDEFETSIRREVKKYLHRELDKNPFIFLKVSYG